MLHAHYTFSKSVSSLIRQEVPKAPDIFTLWALCLKTFSDITPIQKYQESSNNLQFRQLLDTDRKNTNRPYVFKNK